MTNDEQFIYWFDQLDNNDVARVGGKNASLGEMYQKLVSQGINLPNGFAITAGAYFYFLEQAGLKDKIKEILSDLNTADIDNLMERGKEVRKLILQAELPADLREQIFEAYRDLENAYNKKDVDVAVRSSATAEDLPDASFAGQQDTYLNVSGEDDLLSAVKHCMASLFTNRAISYRQDKGFDHLSIGLSVGVQKMVRTDKGSSGVMFSIDTESGFQDAVLVNSSWGLGENVVQGKVTPDEFLVFEPTLMAGFAPIVYRRKGTKKIKMIYAAGGERTKDVATTKKEQAAWSLTDDEILQLARWAIQIERHYHRPMDMEWGKDGETGQLFILQARPETIHATKAVTVLEEYKLEERGKVLATGAAVGAKISSGRARIIQSVKEINKFEAGEILITDMTDPDWEPIMKIAAGIITNKGGRTCHAAIVSRELGIPCIVGTGDATDKITDGQEVTLSCAEGDVGRVYEGKVAFTRIDTDLTGLETPETKIMMNIGQPDIAFRSSFIPNSGVGLAREEFIIINQVKIHPLALLHYDNLKDTKAKKEITALTDGYDDKGQYFVDRLAEGVGQIAAAFYPKDVILRLSDFKSNEYANLIGGAEFEPTESNPMIGWRGASRYYAEEYKQAFLLECRAIKKVRDEMGLVNTKVMVPFCRTPEEGRKVIGVMAEGGLVQGENGLEIYMMCEIPSNVILADEFCDIFDGLSIGSNDLTQLILGVDRDSSLVAHIYDERNEAVKRMISQVIKSAKAKNKKIGICGQAPSDFPDFAQFLVQAGIDSISLNPDTVVKTTLAILEEEKTLRLAEDGSDDEN
ncbi:MAG: phosphoenolpyruvate synthase [Candidatus Paceibacterota bacterium]